ncbi:MAG TPA: antibiotic biosynthesis monooxygenase family protein [Nitrolancea sp.]|nr:antibiotic biosynthesis monooxygenase family protein [Nitrolancea sp.]
MANVVLINVFEVPEDKDEELLAGWEQGKAIMERQPGYVSTALHRSLDPTARFRYINMAVWESAEDFSAALNNPEFVAYRNAFPFTHYPSVYEVIRR